MLALWAMNTYLIILPQGVNAASQDFQSLFRGVKHTQVMNNVFLVHSRDNLSVWYQAIKGAATTAGTVGTTTPVILPVDTADLGAVSAQLPQMITEFLSQSSQAA